MPLGVADIQIAVSKAIRRGAKIIGKVRDEGNHQKLSAKAELLQGMGQGWGGEKSRHSIDHRIGLVLVWLESVGLWTVRASMG